MSDPAAASRVEAGHPWVARVVLLIAGLAALFLAAGLVLAVRAGDIHVSLTRDALRRPLAATLEGDPTGLLALGVVLLLSLPLARDVAIVLIAAREGARSRAALAAVGALALIALYVALALGAAG